MKKLVLTSVDPDENQLNKQELRQILGGFSDYSEEESESEDCYFACSPGCQAGCVPGDKCGKGCSPGNK